MARRAIAIVVTIIVTVSVIGGRTIRGAAPTVAQQQPCLNAPDATQAQRDRRMQAIRTARQINTEEARLFGANHTYRPQSDLAGAPPPDDFVLTLTTDGATYAFSLKDKRDACYYAIFSDQAGVIYEGSPLR